MLRRSLLTGAAAGLILPPAIARPARALTGSQYESLLGNGVPSWVLRGTVPADLDFNFAQGLYYQSGLNGLGPSQLITTVRASVGYAADTSGIWTLFGNNVARITNQGLLVEEARTNNALWARDMTNAAWIKVNMTAALTAMGIDNTPNAASTLTATAGNATALQTVTLGSTADTYSVFLKRVSGSGTINITENGGTLWTPVVLTTSWQRFQVTATLANPVVGIQIVTSGDVIAADFNQLEPGGFALSPILTTNAAVARAADLVSVTNPLLSFPQTTVVAATPNTPITASTQILLSVNDGSGNNISEMRRQSPTGILRFSIVSGATTKFTGDTAVGWAQSASGKAALSDAVVPGSAFNGTFVASGNVTAFPVGVNQISIGSRAGVAPWNGVIQRISMFSNAQPDATLKAFTQ